MTELDNHIRRALVAHNAAVATIEAMSTPKGFIEQGDGLRVAIDQFNRTHATLFYHLAMKQQELDEGGVPPYPVMVGNNDFQAIIYEMERDVTGAWGNTMMEPDRYGINTPMEGRPRGVGVENP